MLTFLRNKKENILIKIVLFVIILSFAAFFGASTLSPGARRAEVPAIVNGEDINPSKYNYYINNRLEQLRKVFKSKIPEQFVTNAKRNVLYSLINQELIHQALDKFGFRTSDAELVEFIKTDPQFRNENA